MRLVFAVLSACVLVCFGVLASPAKAGDYYDGNGYYNGNGNGNGYYRSGYYNGNGNGNGYSSSSCCYRRVVRYERTYDSYADRPYYRSSYYDRPYYRSSYYGRSRYDDGYVSSRYVDDYSASSRYSGYSNCYARQVPVADGRGGWVWGARSSCY